MRVLVAGAASWDTVVHLAGWPSPRQTVFAERSYETVGSTGAGKALNLARLGHEVVLHTVLGDDPSGERVRSELVAAGIEVHAASSRTGTEQHVNLMTPDGERTSIYRNLAEPDRLDLETVVELAAAADVVVLNITDYVRRLVPELVRRRIPFWTDLHDWDGQNLCHVDFLAAASIVLSDLALGDRATEVARTLAVQGKLVVCTHGSRGATLWRNADEPVHAPAVAVEGVVDTNGAGDAFAAGLIHGLQRGWLLRRALYGATLAGASAVGSEHLASPSLSASWLDEQTAAFDRDRLRITFDRAATTYQSARPDYPEVLFDRLLALTGLQAGDRILEVGAGPGKATLPLARRGLHVIAIEPGAELAEQARRNLAAFPVEVIQARFEDWTGRANHLDERGFDAVVAATSWHWVDPERRYRIAAKALRPGGHLAIWSASHVFPVGGDPFFADLQQVYEDIGAAQPGDDVRPAPGELPDQAAEIEASGLFDLVAVEHVDWTLDYDADSYIALLETFSSHIALAEPDRNHLFAEIRRRLAGRPSGRLTRGWGAVLQVARVRDGESPRRRPPASTGE